MKKASRAAPEKKPTKRGLEILTFCKQPRSLEDIKAQFKISGGSAGNILSTLNHRGWCKQNKKFWETTRKGLAVCR